eukprot:5068103-Amphidinium_carterae.1
MEQVALLPPLGSQRTPCYSRQSVLADQPPMEVTPAALPDADAEEESDYDGDEIATFADGMSPKNYEDVGPNHIDVQCLPLFGSSSLPASTSGINASGVTSNKIPSGSDTAAAGSLPIRQTKPDQKKKGKKKLVKLDPTILSAIDEAAEN